MSKKASLLLCAVILFLAVMGGCRPGSTPSATSVGRTPILPTPISSTLISPTLTAEQEEKTIVVNSTADSGPGSLRQAMLEAKPNDTITFDPTEFPPDAPATIALSSGLPELNQGNQTIDASNAGVILDGSHIGAGESQHGLSISSDYNTIRGLQIVGFPDAGIALHSGAEYNIIGGERGEGSGTLGQGNLLSGNGNFGIGLWEDGTSHNTIQGNTIGIHLDGTTTWGQARDGIHSNGANENLITGNVIGGNETGVYLCCVEEGRNILTGNIIGTDASETNHLGNNLAGVLIDRSGYNMIGPGNIIAYNNEAGVMFWEDTPYNTITQNSIHDNGEQGISLGSSRTDRPAAPILFEFNLEAGSLAGWTCANCSVEIYSDSGDEGAIFEGLVISDGSGDFAFRKGSAFAGPYLTATVTDPNGNTSRFSMPTAEKGRSITIQEGNSLPKTGLKTKHSSELEDNRTGTSYAGSGLWKGVNDLDRILSEITDLGVKRVDTSLYEIEAPIDWSPSEYDIPEEFDNFIDNLGENGVAVNYIIHYWDKAGHAKGEELSTPRFKTEKQVQDYLDYVRFLVQHFKSRIQYYTLWSEPDNNGQPIKYIEPEDYIQLAKRAIPVIRQEDPKAKVVTAPNVLFFARDYLFTILKSDVMPMFDVISWHPFYDAAPDIEFFGNYYYEYPAIIEEIKETAAAHGFQGEYWGTEITWCSEGFPSCKPPDQPWGMHNEIQSAKYYARGIVMEQGMDLSVGLGGFQINAPWSYPTIRNLNTLMAGAKPTSLAVEIESGSSNMMSYGFSLPNGDVLFALWTNAAAVDDDPGVRATITFADLTAEKMVGIDVLNGFEQELVSENENGKLVIRNLLVKDYPLIVRLIDALLP